MLTSTSSSLLSCSVILGSVWPSLSGPLELVAAFFFSLPSSLPSASPFAALLELDRAERLLSSFSFESFEAFLVDEALPLAVLVLAAFELLAAAWCQLASQTMSLPWDQQRQQQHARCAASRGCPTWALSSGGSEAKLQLECSCFTSAGRVDNVELFEREGRRSGRRRRLGVHGVSESFCERLCCVEASERRSEAATEPRAASRGEVRLTGPDPGWDIRCR